MADIYPKLPVKEGAIRLIDQKVQDLGFTSEWETKRAIEKMLEIQNAHEFPLIRYALVFVAAIGVWQLFKHRVFLYNYFYPPEKRELNKALKQIESWRQKPPKTEEDFSSRYSAMVVLVKKKLNISRSANYQELQKQKGLEALAKRAEGALFAKQTPNNKEYESDLESVASLFQL